MISTILALALVQSVPVQEGSSQPGQATPTPSATPKACDGEAHDAFDFWVGEWDVYPTGGEQQVATSRIERMSDGCAIRETWMPFQGAGGTSVSMVNHNTGRWEQVWIGSDGNRVDFTGGVVDGAMVLTGYWDNVGGPDQDALVRMTYSEVEDGAVRQFGEASTNHGVSWQPFFDFTYRPRETEQP